jgi:hypothetical protein
MEEPLSFKQRGHVETIIQPQAQIFLLVGILFRINRKATKERDDGKKFYQISSAQCSIGPDLLRCR